ncbi:hypothetical protein AJ80_05261 [Polytolypa hystricis UAMH7299]|uniref:Uncharacterized protein n=1 Tax=Polytolypa hystricis (strain UAMH7299) TaxID=1447883 RepID=A0A2B7Y5R0_POLH7|nr:hypothetical protein AJ80_05261 [Polytolypa hystricis UAMH7299]
MSVDILGNIVSVLDLVDYGYRFANARKEIDVFRKIVDNTFSLLTSVQENLRATEILLTTRDRDKIYDEIKRAKTLLEKAKRMAGDAGQSQKRNVGWVFKTKNPAAMYQAAVLQWHHTLLSRQVELAILRSARPSATNSFVFGVNGASYSPFREVQSANQNQALLDWSRDGTQLRLFPRLPREQHRLLAPLASDPSTSMISRYYSRQGAAEADIDVGSWLTNRRHENMLRMP